MTKTVSQVPARPVVIDQHGIVQGGPPITILAVTEQPHNGLVQTLADWQGLEAGGLAIVAAGIGAWVLNRQTRQNRTLEEDRRRRQLRALRAVLPLTLSSLGEWADACGRVLLDAYARSRGSGVSRDKLGEVPPIPTDALAQLERFVEVGDDAGAESVANLLGDIQIFTARMRGAGFLPGGAAARNQVPTDLESHLLGLGAVAGHVAALFDYSRRRSEETPSRPSWEQVRTALKLVGADPATEPKLFERLEAREGTGKLPGYLGDAAT